MPRAHSLSGSWVQPGGADVVAWKGSAGPPADRGTGLWDPTTRQGLEPGADGPFWVPRNVKPPLVCGHAWDCPAQGLGTWGSVSRRKKPACAQTPVEPGTPPL